MQNFKNLLKLVNTIPSKNKTLKEVKSMLKNAYDESVLERNKKAIFEDFETDKIMAKLDKGKKLTNNELVKSVAQIEENQKSNIPNPFDDDYTMKIIEQLKNKNTIVKKSGSKQITISKPVPESIFDKLTLEPFSTDYDKYFRSTILQRIRYNRMKKDAVISLQLKTPAPELYLTAKQIASQQLKGSAGHKSHMELFEQRMNIKYYNSPTKNINVFGDAYIRIQEPVSKDVKTKNMFDEENAKENNDIVIRPFTYMNLKIPIDMTPAEIYELIAIYETNKRKDKTSVTAWSPSYIGVFVGADLHISEAKETNIKEMKTKGLTLQSRILKDINQNKEVKVREGYCAFDYFYEMVAGSNNHKTLTKETLKQQCQKLQIDIEEGLSTNDLTKLRDEYYTDVSIYAVDPLQNVFISSPATNTRSEIALLFMINNKHLYPILSTEIRDQIAKGHNKTIDLPEFNYSVEFGENDYTIINLEKREDFFEGKINSKVCVIPDPTSMPEIMNELIKRHNYMIDQFYFSSKNTIESFIHPLTKQLVIASDDIQKRIDTCHKIYEQMPFNDFIFRNQSFPAIAMSLAKHLCGEVEKSQTNTTVTQTLDHFSCKPMIQCLCDLTDPDFDEKQKNQGLRGFDIFKDHSSILLKNNYDIPIYSIHDKIEDYDNKDIECGEYYINRVQTKYKYNTTSETRYLIIREGFYSWSAIKYFLENNLIKKTDIKKMIKSRIHLKADVFKSFVQYCFNTFEEKIAKDLVNLYIGTFNSKYSKKMKGCMTDDEDMINYLFFSSTEKKQDFKLNYYNGLYFVKVSSKRRLSQDHCSIYRHVISQSVVNLFELLKQATTEESQVYTVHTDSIMIDKVNPNFNVKITFDQSKQLRSGDLSMFGNSREIMTDHLGCYRDEEIKLGEMLTEFATELLFDDFKPTPLSGKGKVFTGLAGSGKTTKLIDLIIEAQEKKEKYAILSLTHKVVNTINKRLKTALKKINKTPTVQAIVFDKMFSECLSIPNMMSKKLSKLNSLFIDEFSMMSYKYASIIYEAVYQNPNLKVHFMGDQNQLPSVEGDGHLLYQFTSSPAINDICDEIVTLPYIAGCARYDDKLKTILDTFLETGKINKDIFKQPIDSYINLCYYNKTRIDINKKCCERYIKEKKFNSIPIIFKYQGKKEEYNVAIGMPIIVTSNYLKELNMYNNNQYIINSINSETVHLTLKDAESQEEMNGVDVPMKQFQDNCNICFACTIHKYQGATISEPFNIYDTDAYKMSKNALYTAISRATCADHVHISKLKNKYYPEVYNDERLAFINSGGKWKNGKIYEISFSNGLKYIGETTKEINERLDEHIKDEKSIVYKYKNYEPIIKLICKAPCFNKRQLEEVETYYINKYKSEYQDKLLNHRQLIKPIEFKATLLPPPKKDTFKIQNNEKLQQFYIRVRRQDIQVYKTIHYDETTKDEAYKKMIEYKNELVKKYSE